MESPEKAIRSRRWTRDDRAALLVAPPAGNGFCPADLLRFVGGGVGDHEGVVRRDRSQRADRGMRGAAHFAPARIGDGQPDRPHRPARDLFRLFIAPARLHAATDECPARVVHHRHRSRALRADPALAGTRWPNEFRHGGGGQLARPGDGRGGATTISAARRR